ncbi:MAG: hypothetical protein HOO88_09040 [Kiritimatiellaceae bacterium]|nr:hypothetical protein [Kiritimatiellaceae bacterium]
MMKVRALIVQFVVIPLLCCYGSPPANELPMYGEGLKSPEVQKANLEFVDWAVKECGNREKASDGYVELGWKYYDRNDLSTAMKRFNQAWLLNTNNADAYQGLGAIVGRRAETEADIRQSVTLLKIAKEKAPENGRITIDLAVSHMTLGAFLNFKKKKGAEDEFSKAQDLFDEAMKTESANSNLYYNCSALELYRGNYLSAKAKLDEAVRLGYTPSPSFLKDMDHLKELSERNTK